MSSKSAHRSQQHQRDFGPEISQKEEHITQAPVSRGVSSSGPAKSYGAYSSWAGFGSTSQSCGSSSSKCGTTLTKRDFWRHSDNEYLAAMIKGCYDCLLIENYGLNSHQVTPTEAFANLISFWFFVTYKLFGLNGRKGLEESNAPQALKDNFFSSPEQFDEIVTRVLPNQMLGHWAAADREGPTYKRFDSLAEMYGLSQLAVPDLKFYYLGCSYEGMNACEWAATPDAFWPPGLSPNATLQEVLALAISEIALTEYNVDNRRLVGVTGLAAFTDVTLTIRQLIVAPFPEDTVTKSEWLCFIWFGIQQVAVAILNASVCQMNYRFSEAVLTGPLFWCALRWFSEMYHSLHIPSGGTVPVDQPTLTTALSRIANLLCSIYRENNRGGFCFKECDITTTTTVSEPKACTKLCGQPSGDCGNDSTASVNGDGLCQCPKCCDVDCPPPCDPCPASTCETCPTTDAPQCILALPKLVAAFVDFAYVTTGSLSLSSASSSSSSSSSSIPVASGSAGTVSSSSSSSTSSSSSSAAPLSLDDFSNPFALKSDGVTGATRSASLNPVPNFRSTGLGDAILSTWDSTLESIFKEIRRSSGSRRSSRLLARLYLHLFSSVQATNLAHNFFTLNPSAIIEALTVELEVIFRFTLARGNSQLIRLNHSPLKVPRIAFTAINSAIVPSQVRSVFITCTNDIQSGLRFDYCTMTEAINRVAEPDSWAFYRQKRLEGFTPCEWSRLSSCYWAVDPDMKLSDALAHPLMQIYLVPYLEDNRSFMGIPGLSAFADVELTLREVLANESPITGSDYLSFIWKFVIQGGLAGFLNANLSCIYYRFGGLAWMGLPFFFLRIFSDAVFALNMVVGPQPPIDTPLLMATFGRIITYTDTLAQENARGVKHRKDFRLDSSAFCCTSRCGCSCKPEYLESPDPLVLANSFIQYMTLP